MHPQHWPEDLDHSGKRVVVIGSSATAITLVPSMADTAAHVTMLQRSPTYILALPAEDPVSTVLRKLHVPAGLVHRVGRARNIALQRGLYALCRKAPWLMRKVLLGAVRARLGKGVDMRHFTPSYKPWDQRLCVVPGGDLFKTLKSGRASVVTDRIETFTENGIRVKSGEEIPADIVITATGLRLQLAGGMEIAVDGKPLVTRDHLLYKGVMLDGVPNLAMIIGYTNASWTLKADLACAYVSRLIAHMDRHGLTSATPSPPRQTAPTCPSWASRSPPATSRAATRSCPARASGTPGGSGTTTTATAGPAELPDRGPRPPLRADRPRHTARHRPAGPRPGGLTPLPTLPEPDARARERGRR